MLAHSQPSNRDDEGLNTGLHALDKDRSAVASTPQPPTSAPAPRQPRVFNLIIAGQARTGKTALLKLLLDTSLLATTMSQPRIAGLAEFAYYAATCPTVNLSFATAELPRTAQRPEVILNLIDTPGLQFHDPQELEKGVNLLLRQITDSFAASLSAPVSYRSCLPLG